MQVPLRAYVDSLRLLPCGVDLGNLVAQGSIARLSGRRVKFFKRVKVPLRAGWTGWFVLELCVRVQVWEVEGCRAGSLICR